MKFGIGQAVTLYSSTQRPDFLHGVLAEVAAQPVSCSISGRVSVASRV